MMLLEKTMVFSPFTRHPECRVLRVVDPFNLFCASLMLVCVLVFALLLLLRSNQRRHYWGGASRKEGDLRFYYSVHYSIIVLKIKML